MAWMFRWFEQFLARFRGSESTGAGWVEPSNSITRAVLGGYVADLPETLPERTPAEVVELPARPQPATRTAQRTRRRRAGRAA